MSIKTIPFYQLHPSAWNWPLKIGVLNKSTEFIEILNSGYWTKEFAIIENISTSNNKVNILYFDGDLASLQKEIYNTSCNTDIVILNGGQSNFLNEQESDRNTKIL